MSARGQWPFRLECLVAVGAIFVLALYWFHAWQLPRWSAWLAAGATGAAALTWFRAGSGRPGSRVHLGAAILVLLAGGTIGVGQIRQGTDSPTGSRLERPLLVEIPAQADSVAGYEAREYLVEALSILPGLDVVTAASREALPSSAAARAAVIETTVAGGSAAATDGERQSRPVRLLDPAGAESWLGAIDLDAGSAESEASLRGLATQLGVTIDDDLAARLAALRAAAPAVLADYYAVLGEWRRRGPLHPGIAAALARLATVLEREPAFDPAQTLGANLMLAAGLQVDAGSEAQLADLTADARARQALAGLAASRGEGDAAREHIAMARALGPSDVWIALDDAALRVRAGDCSAAGDAAGRAVMLAPASGAVAVMAGQMAFYCGALDRALTLAELGAQDGAAGPELDLLRASVHVARSDAAAAADALELYESRAERSSALDALAAYLHARIGADDAAARLADAVLGVDRQGGAPAATQSFALMATGDYLSALRTLFAGRAEPGTGAAARLVAGIIRNAWVDPVLNEPAFREVRQDLMLR